MTLPTLDSIAWPLAAPVVRPAGAPASRVPAGTPFGDVGTETDEALASAARAGSRDAFATLVHRLHGRVFSFLFQATRHRSDAEDLTQETLVRAWQAIDRYDAPRPFAPWLFGIARHVLGHHFRCRRSEVELPDDLDQQAAEGPTPAEGALANDDAAGLWRQARRLKPRHFEALWLRYAEGFELAEVARALGISRLHTKVVLHRARAELARRLGGRAPNGGHFTCDA